MPKTDLPKAGEKARAMINDGIIYINGKKCEKPGQQADFENARIELRGETRAT